MPPSAAGACEQNTQTDQTNWSDAAHYGDRNAAIYDLIYPRVEAGLLDCLAALAGREPALELGVGTGRVALPLAMRGVTVSGVDASLAMLQRLRRHPDHQHIQTLHANFGVDELGGPYRLIYALVSTLNLLPDLATVGRCLQNLRRHLRPDGLLLIESYDSPVDSGQRQSLQVPIATASGTAMYRVDELAISVSDLDQLAIQARFTLSDRWRDWHRSPWRPNSGQLSRHISLFQAAH